MKEITITQSSKLTFPNPITLVCTETPEGHTNLAAVSWWPLVPFNPPMLAFTMMQ